MVDAPVSVVIPTNNRKTSVVQAIESALNQTCSPLETIVVDDASTDGTAEALSDQFGERIRLYQQPKKGVSAARNLGIEKSQGHWIALLDSDDLWHEQKLERQLTFHKDNPGIKISQTQELWIRRGRRVSARKRHRKPEGYIFPQSLELCLISPSAVMMTRELFNNSGGFDEDMAVCEDYDLWLRVAAQNEVGLVDEPLITKFGGHEDQLSRQYPAMDRFRLYSLLKVLSTGFLTGNQREQAISAARQKLDILKAGARKRKSDIKSLEDLATNVFTRKISLNIYKKAGKELLLNNNRYQ